MARKTLEFMCRGEVYDHEWGGFFRYATRRDWSEPHYEKMLEDNAGLLKDLLTLYCITNDQEHAGYARRTIDYIEWKLRDKEDGYFYGSQDADEEFYKLPADQRKGREEPYIDRTCYTSWNAMMISAYLQAAWTLTRPDLRDEALRALDFLWGEMRDPSRGMYRFRAPGPSGEGQVLGLLGDQAHTARALLDAYEVNAETRHFEAALELAQFMRERFYDGENGGFFDIWDEALELGRLKERQKSIGDNAVCAEVFTRLYHLTHDEAYNDVARRTLEAFVTTFPQMGYFAAAYAKQADICLNPPVEVNIVGHHESAEPLHWAALSLNVPARIVQLLDPETDVQRLAALSLPGQPSPAAYVCYKMTCSAPVTEPDQLFDAVQKIADTGVIDLGRR